MVTYSYKSIPDPFSVLPEISKSLPFRALMDPPPAFVGQPEMVLLDIVNPVKLCV